MRSVEKKFAILSNTAVPVLYASLLFTRSEERLTNEIRPSESWNAVLFPSAASVVGWVRIASSRWRAKSIPLPVGETGPAAALRPFPAGRPLPPGAKVVTTGADWGGWHLTRLSVSPVVNWDGMAGIQMYTPLGLYSVPLGFTDLPGVGASPSMSTLSHEFGGLVEAGTQ